LVTVIEENILLQKNIKVPSFVVINYKS